MTGRPAGEMWDVFRLDIITFYKVTLNLLWKSKRKRLGQPFVLRGIIEAGLYCERPALASLLPWKAALSPVRSTPAHVSRYRWVFSSRQATFPRMHGTDYKSQQRPAYFPSLLMHIQLEFWGEGGRFSFFLFSSSSVSRKMGQAGTTNRWKEKERKKNKH